MSSVTALLCACGSPSEANPGDPGTQAAPPLAYYCKQWPDARGFCDGPTLNAEDAAALIPQRYTLKGNERLITIESSNGGGLAPDGQQILTGDGWGFYYDLGDLGEWLTVRDPPRDPFYGQGGCAQGSVNANGLTRLVQTASDLMRSQEAMATFEPGTYFMYVERRVDCESGLSGTIVNFRFMSDTYYREHTVEFDDKGALVAVCDADWLMFGCP